MEEKKAFENSITPLIIFSNITVVSCIGGGKQSNQLPQVVLSTFCHEQDSNSQL
jgi:hypothetical protein